MSIHEIQIINIYEQNVNNNIVERIPQCVCGHATYGINHIFIKDLTCNKSTEIDTNIPFTLRRSQLYNSSWKNIENIQQYTKIELNYRVPGSFVLRAQLQYDHFASDYSQEQQGYSHFRILEIHINDIQEHNNNNNRNT